MSEMTWLAVILVVGFIISITREVLLWWLKKRKADLAKEQEQDEKCQ